MNKFYVFLYVLLFGIFYLIDVFVGMLLINNEFLNQGLVKFTINVDRYELADRPYDIIEITLLGLMTFENAVKVKIVLSSL
jgi:hypothetical protein